MHPLPISTLGMTRYSHGEKKIFHIETLCRKVLLIDFDLKNLRKFAVIPYPRKLHGLSFSWLIQEIKCVADRDFICLRFLTLIQDSKQHCFGEVCARLGHKERKYAPPMGFTQRVFSPLTFEVEN